MQNPYEYLNLLDDVLDGPEESIIIVNLPERHSAYSFCSQSTDGAAFLPRGSQFDVKPRQDILF